MSSFAFDKNIVCRAQVDKDAFFQPETGDVTSSPPVFHCVSVNKPSFPVYTINLRRSCSFDIIKGLSSSTDFIYLSPFVFNTSCLFLYCKPSPFSSCLRTACLTELRSVGWLRLDAHT